MENNPAGGGEQSRRKIPPRELYDRVMTPNYAPLSIVPARGRGAKLWDADGNMYVDFAAGIAVSALGHAHPQLRAALAEQADKLWHVSNLLVNAPAIELAEKLCKLTFAERVFFANSGAEVNEAALKLARRYAFDNRAKHRGKNTGGKKEKIIAFDNSFHGRTFFTVCVGGQNKYSDGFGPKPGGIVHLPFNDVDALAKNIGDDTCAVMLELVQGEGGVTPATKEFVQAARELCDRHRAVLIFDEVQTGVGRGGFLYLYQKHNIIPDILTTAKGLGGGLPIGAMLAAQKVAASFTVGSHGSTFGGNPVTCAVANKVLDIVAAPGMLAKVRAKGQLMRDGLAAIHQRREIFCDIRGEGLLLGCELRAPFASRARKLVDLCLRRGLLALAAGDGVLRLAPALTIEDEEIHNGLALLDKAAGDLARAG